MTKETKLDYIYKREKEREDQERLEMEAELYAYREVGIRGLLDIGWGIRFETAKMEYKSKKMLENFKQTVI